MAKVDVWKNSYKQKEFHSFDVAHDFPGIRYPGTVRNITIFLDGNDVADELNVRGYDHSRGAYSETYYLKGKTWERQMK